MYAAAARARRRYYERRPHLRRRLRRPVISIGNLAVGGRAKTPLAAYVAARLQAFGERPAILSRGYARRAADAGVVVVRDPGGIRADLDRAGDEPLMLARELDGVAVLASGSRHLAGHLAERRFGCTVHVLDDGFQHFDLHRDADLVVIAPGDLERPVTLPAGRLREPIDAANAADAFLALDDAPIDQLVGSRPAWRLRRTAGALEGADGALAQPAPAVVALAGIADPAAFLRDVRALGCTIARELRFRDHHRYSWRDVDAIFSAVASADAAGVVTTEKDLVRLLPFRPFPASVACVPLRVSVEPADAFDEWLRGVLARARQ